MKKAIALALGLLVYGAGCAATAAKEDAARASYTGEQIDCVERFRPSRKAIDECREAVFVRWGVKQPELVLKDAGGDR